MDVFIFYAQMCKMCIYHRLAACFSSPLPFFAECIIFLKPPVFGVERVGWHTYYIVTKRLVKINEMGNAISHYLVWLMKMLIQKSANKKSNHFS